LILTICDSDALIHKTLEAGVRGYLLKTDAGRDLVSAVDALSRDKTFFTPKVSQMVLEGYLLRPPKENWDGGNGKNRLGLTPRQDQILQLLAEGKSSREVAVALKYERENCGDPPCQYHAASRLSFGYRTRALRHSQSHHRSLNSGDTSTPTASRKKSL
jgi:hypothetical protein